MERSEAESAEGPLVVRTVEEARRAVREAQRRGLRVGLAPTMGALHAGHLSLIEAARRDCQFVAATIFVNPTQFGPQEDFSKYPRTWLEDLAALRSVGTDLVFAPEAAEVYPPGCSTFVEPPAAARPLEGVCRPGHFRGVATVVLKLFQMLPADVAYFGQKDYQQTLVVRRMVADLNVPMEVVVCPTVREPDGLAMSSRNRYLAPDERRRAAAISSGLRAAEAAFRGGERNGDRLRATVRGELERAGIHEIDYVSVADPESLDELESVATAAIALVACRVGSTRLIDNLRLE